MAARGQAAGALLLLGILATPGAFGLNPALDISQYAHTAWKISDGFSKGIITAITQTPDGYLWLGTEFGLLRFDGVRPVTWRPPRDQPLPSEYLTSLLAARDGTLWIGTLRGLASWKDGRLRQYPELAGQSIERLLEDRSGTLWAGGAGAPNGKLCAIRDGRFDCYGADGSLGRAVHSLYEDTKGNLWVGAADGLWHWKPGPRKFYPLSQLNGIEGLAGDDDGSLVISLHGGIQRFVDEKFQMAYPFPGAAGHSTNERLVLDSDRSLWIGTHGGGLVHVHQGRTDVYEQSDGLSGGTVLTLFEDREGNIWVATSDGLDRFSNVAAASFSVKQGLPGTSVFSIVAANDGAVWINDLARLSRLNRGQVTLFGGRAPSRANAQPNVRWIAGSGLPDHSQSLFQDDRGRIWVATSSVVGYLEKERFVSVKDVPGGIVYAINEDAAGNIWIANEALGLFQLLPGGAVRQISWAALGHRDSGLALVADPLRGGLWVGFSQGGVAYLKDGQVRGSFTTAEGLGEGAVHDLQIDRDGTLWAATEGGLSRVKDGRVATLTSQNGLPCEAVHWVMEDNDHSYWLSMPCGLVRVDRPELEAWASKSKSSGSIHPTVFDNSDGVRSFGAIGGFGPHVSKSPDGKLWFAAGNGLTVIDPRHIPFNRLPPPVHIEQITADRKTYAVAGGRLRLPPLIRDVQIDYTALSLVAPEKMRFRYKLEGRDRDWLDAGNRRQAFYSDLRPGNYRFRVAASNNSGVWNEAGAFADFGVAPAYYQTRWFQASCVAAVLLFLAVLYQLRLHQLKRQLQVRMEERVNERTRLARDLHDTLLQSFQGVLLKFQAVTYLFPDRAEEAPKTLAAVIEEARAAIVEGRDAVYGLRASTVISNDLAKAFHTLGEELAADRQGQPCPECRVQVEGESRDLLPLVRDEVYRIGGEAVRNSFRHAQAARIEVDIHYDRRVLRLRVRDDGKGIDPKILSEGGRAGHFGLPGMHERAKLVGGKLAVWSEADSGTEVELTIPASVAYSKPPERRTLFARRHVG